jgi:hypothetical protein
MSSRKLFFGKWGGILVAGDVFNVGSRRILAPPALHIVVIENSRDHRWKRLAWGKLMDAVIETIDKLEEVY